MKYNPKDYSIPLREEMENVEKVYKIYKKDENNDDKYWELKKAIYSFSLILKSAKVCGTISPAKAEELSEYYWGLLL